MINSYEKEVKTAHGFKKKKRQKTNPELRKPPHKHDAHKV